MHNATHNPDKTQHLVFGWWNFIEVNGIKQLESKHWCWTRVGREGWSRLKGCEQIVNWQEIAPTWKCHWSHLHLMDHKFLDVPPNHFWSIPTMRLKHHDISMWMPFESFVRHNCELLLPCWKLFFLPITVQTGTQLTFTLIFYTENCKCQPCSLAIVFECCSRGCEPMRKARTAFQLSLSWAWLRTLGFSRQVTSAQWASINHIHTCWKLSKPPRLQAQV